MARTAGSDGERTQAAIREAASALIARFGYEAVTMRRLGEEVGVQAAALYRYFPTKEDLLFGLMRDHMDALIEDARAAGVDRGSATERLVAFVDNHIRFHVARRHSTQVSNLELRSLSRDRLSTILKLRATYEKSLRQTLRDGAEDGSFRIDDVGLTAMAVIQMVTGVVVWFRPGERLSVDEVVRTYTAMTLRLVGAASDTEDTDVRRRSRLRAG